MVRAYSDTVNLVINSSKLIKYEKLESINLEFDYSILSLVEYIINNLEISITNKDFSDKVKLTLDVTDEQYEELKKQLPREINI